MSLLSSVSHQLRPETTSLMLYLLCPPVESSKSFLWFWQLQSATQAASQKRERENTFLSPLFMKELQYAGDSRRDVFLYCCLTRWDSQENIIDVLLHPRGFYGCSHFYFQFVLRFDRTTAKWDISFLFYRFDLIILFLLLQDLDLFHVFSLGR